MLRITYIAVLFTLLCSRLKSLASPIFKWHVVLGFTMHCLILKNYFDKDYAQAFNTMSAPFSPITMAGKFVLVVTTFGWIELSITLSPLVPTTLLKLNLLNYTFSTSSNLYFQPQIRINDRCFVLWTTSHFDCWGVMPVSKYSLYRLDIII